MVCEIKKYMPVSITRGVCLSFVDDAPIVYDIETVVVELEKESVEVWTHKRVIGLNKAIDIVRNGGVK